MFRNVIQNAVRFENFMAIKIQAIVFWVVTPHSNVARYQHFRGFPFTLKTKAVRSSKMLADCHTTRWYHNPETTV
jgi:hypothetical protein